jgi:hypothetical protein
MMNKGILRTIVVIVIIGIIGYFFSQSKSALPPVTQNTSITSPPTASPSSSSITFPKGGETLKQGQIYTLTWTPETGNTNIFLVDTGFESQGTSVSLVDRVYNIPNSGSYTYTVPKDLPDGTYRFQIGTMNTATFQIRNSTK